jgi:hypothetical protein
VFGAEHINKEESTMAKSKISSSSRSKSTNAKTCKTHSKTELKYQTFIINGKDISGLTAEGAAIVAADPRYAEYNFLSFYTREHAIADGVFIDLSSRFPYQTSFFRINVCCTSAVFDSIRASEHDQRTIESIVEHICYELWLKLQAGRNLCDFMIKVELTKAFTPLHVVIDAVSPIDPELGITIMLPGED